MDNTSVLDLNRKDYEEILSIPIHLVVILSYDGRIIKSNISEGRILGWNPDELVEMSLQNFIHVDDRENINNVLGLLISGQELTASVSARCKHKNGDYRWIAWTGIPKDGHIYAVGTDNSKSVETEIALIQNTSIQKELQTRFIKFFEQSTLAMEIYSLDGFPVAVNKAWEKLFDTDRAQLCRYKVEQDPLVINTPLKDYLQRAYYGESIEVPAFLYEPAKSNKTGKVRWLEASISPVKDELNAIREVAVIFKDVTDKIETEQALVKSVLARRATEEKFKIISERLGMAVKAGNVGIWEWIPDTNHVNWDETTESIYGYEKGNFPRTTEAFNLRLHPEDRENLWVTISRALKDKTSYRIDHRIIREDGTQRWVQESGMALYDHHDKPFHMMGTVMDITDRIEAEADQKFLSQASELLNGSLDYREILKTLSDYAIDYFCDGVIIDELESDGTIKRLMVVHPDEKVVNNFETFENEYPERHISNSVINTLITGKALFVEEADSFIDQHCQNQSKSYIKKIKSLNIKSSIGVRLKGRESILGMITFLVMKKSGKELKKKHLWLSEELAYRVSMAYENSLIHQSSQEAIRSRDEFLSIASHELKTPLQSLTLQNQMRKRNLGKNLVDAFTPEKVSTMIEADLRHLMRITRLIDDMLDISRIRAGKLTFMKEKIEFNSFVKDVFERFKPQVEAIGCYITLSCTTEVITHIDIYRIEQVIVNLLTNAMKYGAGTPIKVEIFKKDDKIQLHVHDQGPGIKYEDTERIFERFERAISSNEVSGLGLGLYISRQIMEQNDGRLYVLSVLGKGSTFVMELPIEDVALH
jgi:PAS domain S-box-containing protein